MTYDLDISLSVSKKEPQTQRLSALRSVRSPNLNPISSGHVSKTHDPSHSIHQQFPQTFPPLWHFVLRFHVISCFCKKNMFLASWGGTDFHVPFMANLLTIYLSCFYFPKILLFIWISKGKKSKKKWCWCCNPLLYLSYLSGVFGSFICLSFLPIDQSFLTWFSE